MDSCKTHAQVTKAFLVATDAKTKAEILGNIAKHYGITPQQALEEVTRDGAEHLLDYLPSPLRAAVSVLMQRYQMTA